MSTTTYAPSDYDADSVQPYRAVSKAAVATLVIAFLSLLAFLYPVFLVIPCLGVVLGTIGLLNIRRYPRELTGATIGAIGLILCLGAFSSASGFHLYVYLTEVPDGYVRISFFDLQPNPKYPELPVPPEALELDGKRVFVKGYVYPDGRQENIKQFVLVPDMGTCCFGGQPKLTDMVEVTLKDPFRIEYSRQRRKLGGILRVDTKKKPVSGLDGVYYQLEADYLK